mmetsp:Transcript_67226/g.112585  ORF Transcript_67226/g.112585 Transcript_67226/m.112585 type:complete len:240 (+) Transcript_67226:663-1382(+)
MKRQNTSKRPLPHACVVFHVVRTSCDHRLPHRWSQVTQILHVTMLHQMNECPPPLNPSRVSCLIHTFYALRTPDNWLEDMHLTILHSLHRGCKKNMCLCLHNSSWWKQVSEGCVVQHCTRIPLECDSSLLVKTFCETSAECRMSNNPNHHQPTPPMTHTPKTYLQTPAMTHTPYALKGSVRPLPPSIAHAHDGGGGGGTASGIIEDDGPPLALKDSCSVKICFVSSHEVVKRPGSLSIS